MLPEAEFPQFIESRQRDLTLLSRQARGIGSTLTPRQRAGRLLIRFGYWIEGCRSDLRHDPAPPVVPTAARV